MHLLRVLAVFLVFSIIIVKASGKTTPHPGSRATKSHRTPKSKSPRTKSPRNYYGARRAPGLYAGPQSEVTKGGKNPEENELYAWVATTGPTCKELEGRALEAGIDVGGSLLWICRARYEDDIIPGKAIPDHEVAYVSYGGKDREVEDIEVFCTSRPDLFAWVPDSNGKVPFGAIIGGKTVSGENLYIGRVEYAFSLTPGKIHPSKGCIYIPFKGEEIELQNYEVLCEA